MSQDQPLMGLFNSIVFSLNHLSDKCKLVLGLLCVAKITHI